MIVETDILILISAIELINKDLPLLLSRPLRSEEKVSIGVKGQEPAAEQESATGYQSMKYINVPSFIHLTHW